MELNYSDEELAMLPYYCVFQYEKDPELLKAYRRGVDEWWQNIRREANPPCAGVAGLGKINQVDPRGGAGPPLRNDTSDEPSG